jgi:hypothetical protein
LRLSEPASLTFTSGCPAALRAVTICLCANAAAVPTSNRQSAATTGAVIFFFAVFMRYLLQVV